MDKIDLNALPAGAQRDRKIFFRSIMWYTLLFAAISAVIYLPFMLEGRSLIWKSDGLAQHFTKLVYFCKTFRESLRSLFSGEGWSFPMFDLSRSIVAADTQYGFPQVLAALWPQDKIDSFYTFYELLGYYLSGLSFTYFGWWFRQRPIYVMSGAVSYAFSSFAVFSVRHPFYLTPVFLLPLLIVGAEKIMCRERSWLLTVTVFLSLTSAFGVYFSCMQAVFVFLYVCVRFFDLYDTNKLREFIRMWGRLALKAGTGVLLGCFTAVPTLLEILSGSRVGHDIWSYTNAFFYPLDYYKNFLSGFVVLDFGLGDWMRLGFTALCVPALVLLFRRREKKTRTLCILFLILTVMHLIPLVGYVMSGFSNVSNRFNYGYAFCIAVILMFMLPKMEELSLRECLGMWIALAAYLVLSLVCQGQDKSGKIAMSAAALLTAWAAVCVLQFSSRDGFRRLLPLLCLGIACVSVVCSACDIYGILDSDSYQYISEFHVDPYSTINEGQYASLAQSETVAEAEDIFRVSGDSQTVNEENAAFLYDLNGLTAYPYYGQSSSYIDLLTEWEMPRRNVTHRFLGEQRYAAFQTLAGVKYYAARNSGEADWPYGFRKVDEIVNGKNTDAILENENWLPLGYTYDRYILREDYEKLDALDKQQAQLQAVVLEDEPQTRGVRAAEDLAFSAKQIPCEIAETEGVVWEDEELVVEEKNAELTLTFQGLPETETYLRVKDLDLTNGGSTRSWKLTAKTDETTASGYWSADAYVYANLRHTQMLDLGWSEDGMTSVTLTFPDKGTFKLEDLQIWCQSMDDFSAQAAALRAEPLENIQTNWRGLTGTAAVSKDKFLCVALPWLDGWTAYVDGEEVPLYHANTAFMGLELTAGEHEVELRYWMPGLTAGLILTGLGVLCLAGLVVFERRKRENG